MLISLSFKLHSICREETGKWTPCIVMFQEEFAIADLPETYHRKSKELAFLRILGKLSVPLQLPTFCMLPWICIISYHLLLFNIAVSEACPVLWYTTPEISGFLQLSFHNVTPPQSQEILSFAFTEHMWAALTCTTAVRAAVSSVTEIVEQQGIHLLGNTWGKALKGLLECCRYNNSLVIWILLLSNLGIVNMWV